MAYSSLTRAAIILTVTPSSVVVASPLAAYGAVGSTQNMWTGSDSGLQGMQWAYSRDWVFHAIQIGSVAPSGYSISIYGSNDPRAFVPVSVNNRGEVPGSPYFVQPSGRDGALRLPIAAHPLNGDVTAVPANSWVLLPGPSDQVGTGIDVNPIISVGQMFMARRPLISVRAVLTTSATPVGSLAIVACAV
jgi:hypothetical protein